VAIAYSKLTAQGRISLPASIRKKLGVGPGSVLQWEEDGDRIVVRRAGRYTSADIQKAIFGSKKPTPHTLEELKEGIRTYIRKRHARP
jgi:AbrB family looped-hinge helix DNA binding protein